MSGRATKSMSREKIQQLLMAIGSEPKEDNAQVALSRRKITLKSILRSTIGRSLITSIKNSFRSSTISQIQWLQGCLRNLPSYAGASSM